MNKKTNLAYMRTLTGGDSSKLVKYINLFLQEAPAEIEKMLSMLNEKNWAGLRTAAHTLKPKLGYMGIKELEQDILSIENNAEAQTNLNELPAMVEKVKNICTLAFQELEEEKKQLS